MWENSGIQEGTVAMWGWGATLKGKDERLPGWIPAPKLSRDADSLMPDFPGHLLGVESEGEAQDQTREMVIDSDGRDQQATQGWSRKVSISL